MPPTINAFILFSRAMPPRQDHKRHCTSGLISRRRSLVAHTQCIRQLLNECILGRLRRQVRPSRGFHRDTAGSRRNLVSTAGGCELLNAALVPQGRPKIAHHFNGGVVTRLTGISPVRGERRCCAMTVISVVPDGTWFSFPHDDPPVKTGGDFLPPLRALRAVEVRESP